MSEQLKYTVEFLVKNNQLTATLNGVTDKLFKATGATDKLKVAFDGMGKNANNALRLIKLDSFINVVNSAANGLNNMAEPGLKLSSSLAELQAITNVTGSELKIIEGYARANAKAFGGDAAGSVESYKLLLSKLTPEIAKQPEALQAMGKNVSILSKQMGGDAVAATEVLTTAMNQFQVSTANPIEASKKMAEMMNIMSAGAAAGSAELPELKQAIEASGLAAYTANVSFTETNAALQVLDKSGRKGAEGGISLRNVLAKLSEGRFLPKDTLRELQAANIDINRLGDKSLSLQERLTPLKSIMNDNALVTKLFGTENQNAAIALINNTALMSEYKTSIEQNLNDANRQAAIIMESPAEKAKRLQSNIDDLKLSLFNSTGGMMGYLGVAANMGRTFADLSPIITGMGSAISFVTSATKLQAAWTSIASAANAVWNGVLKIFNITLWTNPLTWVIALVIALIAVIGYLVMRFKGWGDAWAALMDFLKGSWQLFKDSFNYAWLVVKDNFLSGIEVMQRAWYEFKSLWDEEGAQEGLNAIGAQADARKQEMLNARQDAASNLQKTADAFNRIGSSIKDTGKTLGDVSKDIKGKLGINDNPAIPKQPTGINALNKNAGLNKLKNNTKAGDAAKQTANSIATGGTKNTVVNISIKNMVEKFNVSSATGSFKETTGDIKNMVEEVLIRVLASAAASAG
jgi:TP901 family phage tail tape measure protein